MAAILIEPPASEPLSLTEAKNFQAMAIGFGVLRLSSHDFWRLTPREFAAALRALSAPIDRAALEALARRFPDRR